MNRYTACPINYKKVNIYLIKLYSALAATLLIMYLTAEWVWPVYVLAVDYFLRVFLGIRYSFICRLLNFVLQYLHVEPKEIDASSKAFAARLGMSFTLFLTFSIIMDWPVAARITAVIFLIAVLLEVIFSFCLACYFQNLWRHFRQNKNSGNEGIFR